MNDEVESVWVELPRLYKDRNGLIVLYNRHLPFLFNCII